jgi:hypothetical protein
MTPKTRESVKRKEEVKKRKNIKSGKPEKRKIQWNYARRLTQDRKLKKKDTENVIGKYVTLCCNVSHFSATFYGAMDLLIK